MEEARRRRDSSSPPVLADLAVDQNFGPPDSDSNLNTYLIEDLAKIGKFDNISNGNMESAMLSKFKSLKHETVWRKERPKKIRGEDRELNA